MRALPALVGVAVAAAAGCGAAASTPQSGLYGKVTRGPLQPVCQEGVPCDGPALGITLVFVRDGNVVARARTGADGSYRVGLAPGRYSVRIVPRALVPPEPRTVSVPTRTFRRVDFSIDTGIR